MLPVGKYVARAVQAELGFADTGTELVSVRFEITEGEHKGTNTSWRGYFTEKTARRVVESLKYCGWNGDWENWTGISSNEVQLDVQEDRDMKSGEIRGTRVAWVNPAKAPMKNAMDPSQRAHFASRMKGLVTEIMGTPQGKPPARPGGPATTSRRAPAPAPQRRQANQDAEPAYEDEDSIPF